MIFIPTWTDAKPFRLIIHSQTASCAFAMMKTEVFLLLEINGDYDTFDLEKDRLRDCFVGNRYLSYSNGLCSSGVKSFPGSSLSLFLNAQIEFCCSMVSVIAPLIYAVVTLYSSSLTDLRCHFDLILVGLARHTIQLAPAHLVPSWLQNSSSLIISPPSGMVLLIFQLMPPLMCVSLCVSMAKEAVDHATPLNRFHLQSLVQAISFASQTSGDGYQFAIAALSLNQLKDGLNVQSGCCFG